MCLGRVMHWGRQHDITEPSSRRAPPRSQFGQGVREHSVGIRGRKGKATATAASDAELRPANTQARNLTSALGRAGTALLRPDHSAPGLRSAVVGSAATCCPTPPSMSPVSTRGRSFFTRTMGRSPPNAQAPPPPSDGVKTGGIRRLAGSLLRGASFGASSRKATMSVEIDSHRIGSFDEASKASAADAVPAATAVPRASCDSVPGAIADPGSASEDGRLNSSSPRYSVSSRQALSTLRHLDHDLERIESDVAGLLSASEAASRGPSSSSMSIGKVRAALAQLEAEGHKLESGGVDNVYTSDLNSGKDEAKLLKKSLLARLERLFESIENIFQLLKSAETTHQGGNVASDVVVDAATTAPARTSDATDILTPSPESAVHATSSPAPSRAPAGHYVSRNRGSAVSGYTCGVQDVFDIGAANVCNGVESGGHSGGTSSAALVDGERSNDLEKLLAPGFIGDSTST
eukprot:TRINITY_DN55176_c0_g1_i1.p1 TRINITY_DN55176_c0_g1~~TRINITY_DN55176_c0_g1_i1.p1  ORF type:complete len:463 (-),score=70.16 TRINITY_DN55176_c0_g1_i1:70-1458(-)